MKKDFEIDVISLIKIQAKSLGLTQAQLARRLNVSLPTIKRWYQGDFVTIENLKRLCDEVGLTLSEVFTAAEAKSSQQFQYSISQEQSLAKNPDVLAYFDLLLKGHSVRAIEKKVGLNSSQSARYLAQLDRLKLIKWLSRDEIQFCVSGEPVWRKDGPLSKILGAKIRESFLNSVKANETRFFLHSYLTDDMKSLQAKLDEIARFATAANKRAKQNPTEAKEIGLFLAASHFKWDLERSLTLA